MDALDRDLHAAVADLAGPPDSRGRLFTLLRLLLLAAVLLAGTWGFWILPPGPGGLVVLLLAGPSYALLLIATHEMVHGTLLGLPRLEFVLGCLLSWPMAWPFATYSRLHQLHHYWNGSDPRDPERTEALPDEQEHSTGVRGWLQRHPLAWRTFVLGGLGLIADTVWKGWILRHCDPALGPARRLDGLGVLLVHTALLSLALHRGLLGRYLLFWLILERVIGAVVQCRGLIEHHGLWHRERSHVLTQLYATRNVTARAWLNALMGGLPHHSAHHAFPWIPSQRLPEASYRIAAVLHRHGCPPLPRVSSYPAALQQLL